MGNTKVDLVRDLKVKIVEEDFTEQQINNIEQLISNAEAGHYHDFESPIEAPKMQLHLDLTMAGLLDIDKKMHQGAYDDESPSPEEARRLMDLMKK